MMKTVYFLIFSFNQALLSTSVNAKEETKFETGFYCQIYTELNLM